MITEYTLGHQLRTAGSRLLRVPHHNLERYGRRGFSVIDLIDSLELFKSNLKTHLFKAAFVNYL